MNLTKEAQEGYEGGSSPFILSSASDMAWRAGGWCYHNLMGSPVKVTTGRGYRINVETRKGKVVLDFGSDSKVPQVISKPAMLAKQLKTVADFEALSYYTLCRLSDVTRYANPIRALPIRIEEGEYKGILVTDDLGNFVSFA